jgi:hypothetical protein
MCSYIATIFYGILAIALYKPDPRAWPRHMQRRPLDER